MHLKTAKGLVDSGPAALCRQVVCEESRFYITSFFFTSILGFLR